MLQPFLLWVFDRYDSPLNEKLGMMKNVIEQGCC